jgi:hypothetical protein
MPSSQEASLQSHRSLDWGGGGKAKLGQVEYRLVFLRPHQTHQVIDDLGHTENRERRFFLPFDEPLDLGGGRLIAE